MANNKQFHLTVSPQIAIVINRACTAHYAYSHVYTSSGSSCPHNPFRTLCPLSRQICAKTLSAPLTGGGGAGVLWRIHVCIFYYGHMIYLQYARVTMQVVVLPTCYSCHLFLQRIVCRIELFTEWIELS